MFEAFLLQDFRDKPGKTKLVSGQYQIIDAWKEERLITKHNWENIVSPGSYLIMSVIMRKSMQPILRNLSWCLACLASIQNIVGMLTFKAYMADQAKGPWSKECTRTYHLCSGDPQELLSASQTSTFDIADFELEIMEMKFFKHMLHARA